MLAEWYALFCRFSHGDLVERYYMKRQVRAGMLGGWSAHSQHSELLSVLSDGGMDRALGVFSV